MSSGSFNIAFILSLMGGILITLGGFASLLWFMLGGVNFWQMMGGYGGMMDGFGGMMGGYGPGYGGGRGFGPGGGLAALDLSSEQRDKIAVIQEENRRKNWDAMGQMRAEEFKLRQMFNADKVDSNAVAEQQKKVDELRRQMLKSRVDARNQIAAILTPEQRKQFRQFSPWGLEGDD